MSSKIRATLKQKTHYWFLSRKIKAFYCPIDDVSFEEGARAFLQAYGVGKLKPNILLLGYKQNWINCDREELVQYFNVIQ